MVIMIMTLVVERQERRREGRSEKEDKNETNLILVSYILNLSVKIWCSINRFMMKIILRHYSPIPDYQKV